MRASPLRTLSSLDRPVGEDGSATLGDLIPAEDGDPVDELTLTLGDGALARALESLSPTQQRVLELRFGLSGAEPVALQKVGDELGLTRERVRQIEQKRARGALAEPRAPGRPRGGVGAGTDPAPTDAYAVVVVRSSMTSSSNTERKSIIAFRRFSVSWSPFVAASIACPCR